MGFALLTRLSIILKYIQIVISKWTNCPFSAALDMYYDLLMHE